MWTRKKTDKTQASTASKNWGKLQEGTRAVVIKGARAAQIGEVVTVVRKHAVMVQVQFSDETDEGTGMKRPESLLMLEEGLTVRRDRKGYLWVTRGEPDPPKSYATPDNVSWAHVVAEEID
jgi:hypothetical protein